MPESLEAAASKHESSTSISGEDKSKTQNLNSGTVYRLDKGQLISEFPFLVSSFWPKYQRKIWQISALEFEKWPNHMIKTLYDVICKL